MLSLDKNSKSAFVRLRAACGALLLGSLALTACQSAAPGRAGDVPTTATLLESALAATADLTPPSAPSNLAWTNDGMTVTISWGASTDDQGVQGYDLWFGNFYLGTFTDTAIALIGFKVSTPYTFTVKARDAAGNVSVASNETTVLLAPPPDTTPPSAPTNLKATYVADTYVRLSWTASTDDVGVVVYQIYSGATVVGTVPASTSATITGLVPGTTYVFTVTARDGIGNVSAPSASLSVTTLPGVDTTPPSAPTNLAASNVTGTSATLTWNASSDNVGVTGYTLYDVGAVAATTSGLSASVTGLSPGATYSFTVQARDAAGNVSSPSNAVSVTTTVSYTLTIAAGTGGTTYPAPGTYSYSSGATVSVTATPAAGYTFTGWSGACAGTSSSCTVSMTAARSVTAGFSADKCSGPVGTLSGALADGINFLDDKGVAVNAHGGGIIQVGDTFYLHGEYFPPNVTDGNFYGFSMYSSKDLATWKNEGIILPQQASGELGPTRKGERPHIIKCPATGQFVLFAHAADVTYQADKEVVFATSSTVNGQYTYAGVLKNSSGTAIVHSDMSAVVDNGVGYVLTESGHVFQLSTDCHSWLSDQAFGALNPPSGGGESPTVFRAGSTLYWIASNKTGWRANDNVYATASSMTGPWTQQGLLAPSGALTWLSQSTWVIPVTGCSGTTYVYWGDHWYDTENDGVRVPGKHNDLATYVFQPIVFNGTKISLPTYQTTWKLNVGAGTWSN